MPCLVSHSVCSSLSNIDFVSQPPDFFPKASAKVRLFIGTAKLFYKKIEIFLFFDGFRGIGRGLEGLGGLDVRRFRRL